MRRTAHFPTLRRLCVCILLFAASISSTAIADEQHLVLFEEFAKISDGYYREAAKELQGTIFIKRDVEALRKHVAKLINEDAHVLANAMILANMALIQDNIDAKSTPFFLEQLLDHDIWVSAEALAKRAIASGSSYAQARVNYQLGAYFFERDMLDLTFKHLTAIDSSEALTSKQRDYATIMFGIALQKTKRHREAISIYQRIKADSYYYSHAQLNTAIANIRQGWWTDAHLAIEDAIEKKVPTQLREINNRLLLVLAYSQLQNEFYRNARETFRKISLDSIYVNRALLGLGLCALSQKDFSGAVNAFSRLQSVDGDELSILEANLMLPYSLDRMGQLEEAAIRYSEAVAYFEIKMRETEIELLAMQQAGAKPLKETWLAEASPLLVKYYKYLEKFETERTSAELLGRIDALREGYRKAIMSTAIAKQNEKFEYVKSYMSQSQYGLAKLYDTQK